MLTGKRKDEMQRLRTTAKWMLNRRLVTGNWAEVYYQDVGCLLKEVEAMPVALERALRATARKKWPKDKARQDRYVYGHLRKTGWKPSTQKK